MGIITEKNEWEEDVYLIEQTDEVKGGADGISNRQAQQLANRTVFLKESIDGITRNSLGINNVDNTSDDEKPISKLTLEALNKKANKDDVDEIFAPLLNPVFLGKQEGVTASAGNVSKQFATTEFLKNEFVAALSETAGYRKIPCKDVPGGYVIQQWGIGSAFNGASTITLPLSFPNRLMRASAIERAAHAWGDWCWVLGISLQQSSKSQLAVYCRVVTNGGAVTGSGAESFMWEAWGY